MIGPAKRVPRAARRGLAGLAAAGLVCASFLAAAPAVADVDDFSFELFHGVYELGIGADGHSTMQVTETLVADFPDTDQNRGIVRAIPLEYGNTDLHLEVQGVANAQGRPVVYSRADSDGFADLSIDDDAYKHGPTTYVITYTMRDVIAHFDGEGGGAGSDEFYWDVNGNGWAQPFQEVTATIELDPVLLAAVAPGASCYSGAYGATGQCTIVSDGATRSATVTDLGAYETLTIDLPFTPGTVVRPADPAANPIVTVWPVVVPWLAVAVALLATVLRLVLWRDPRPARAIVAEYEPPEAGDLRLHAEVIGRSAKLVSAAFIAAALDGAVRIHDLDPDGAKRLAQGERYGIELVDAGAAKDAAVRSIVSTYFGTRQPGSVVTPGDLGAEHGAELFAFVQGARSRAIALGLRAPATGVWVRVLRWAGWGGFVSLAVPWIYTAVTGIDDSGMWIASIVSGVLAFVTTAITSAPMRLTASGAELRDHLRGVQEYLQVAEADRIRMLQSPRGAERVNAGAAPGATAATAPDVATIVKLYERLLPYAVLWGVEEAWAKVLAVAYRSAAVTPVWTTMNVLDYAWLGAFDSAVSRHVAPLVSSGGGSWGGSGGSSFSSGGFGGGFSGGGGGGGGGGGR